MMHMEEIKEKLSLAEVSGIFFLHCNFLKK
jgi:hypothetical protein